jgi:hypothetical protein
MRRRLLDLTPRNALDVVDSFALRFGQSVARDDNRHLRRLRRNGCGHPYKMSLSVAAIVKSEVAATPMSAHGAHQGQDNSCVSSRFAIVPTMREGANGSN